MGWVGSTIMVYVLFMVVYRWWYVGWDENPLNGTDEIWMDGGRHLCATTRPTTPKRTVDDPPCDLALVDRHGGRLELIGDGVPKGPLVRVGRRDDPEVVLLLAVGLFFWGGRLVVDDGGCCIETDKVHMHIANV